MYVYRTRVHQIFHSYTSVKYTQLHKTNCNPLPSRAFDSVERSESPVSDKLVATDPVYQLRELHCIIWSDVFVKVLTIPGKKQQKITYALLIRTSSS
jgi:hypothetical protein